MALRTTLFPRFIRMVGLSMQLFRADLKSKLCHAIITEVMKDLIPSKRVKWKNNMEGYELPDGDEDECKPGKSESENEEDPSI